MSSIEHLSKIITDPSQPITSRRAAVIELAENSSGVEAFPILSQALSDIAPGVRREAATALSRYNNDDVTEILIDVLRIEENDLTLWTIIEILGTNGTNTALPHLKDLLNSSVSPLTRRELEKSIQLIENRIPTDNKPDKQNIKYDDNEESEKSDYRQQSNNQDVIEFNESDIEKEDGVELSTQPLDQPQKNIDNNIDSDTNIFDNEDTSSDNNQDKIIDISIEDDIQIEDPDSVESTKSQKNKDSDDHSEIFIESKQNSIDHENKYNRNTYTPALPVLVPNTSVVIYDHQEHIYQPSIFDLVLRPNEYLSKRWVSRTRLYIVLFCLLIASTVALIYSQVQRLPHTPYSSRTNLAFVTNPNPYFEDGGLFLQQEDYRRAIDTYELIRYSNNLDQTLYPILYRNLGYAYFQEKRYGAAVEAYEDYLQTSDIQTQTPFTTEYAYASTNNSSLQNDTSKYMTYILLGKAYKNIGHLDEARITFEKAIKIAPNEAEAYSNLALLYSKEFQQKYLLAEALGYAAINLNPNLAAYQNSLGSILIENGQLNKGIDLLEYAVRLHSDYYPAHYNLSIISLDSSEPDQTLNIVIRNLLRNSRPLNQTRTAMLGLLSYIYENKAIEMKRFIPSLYSLRGINRLE